jgi:phosphoribosyl-AMP cyclohydrolase
LAKGEQAVLRAYDMRGYEKYYSKKKKKKKGSSIGNVKSLVRVIIIMIVGIILSTSVLVKSR